MARTLNEIVDSLPETERAKVEARAREPVAGERSLRALREDIGAPGEDCDGARSEDRDATYGEESDGQSGAGAP